MNILEKCQAYEHKTFDDAAALYLAEFTGKCKERQEYALRQVLKYIGDVPLLEICDETLWEFKNDRLKQVMPGTVHKEIGTVRTVLNKAARDYGWVPFIPLIQGVPGPRQQSYPLTRAEERRLLHKLRSDVRLICLFVLNTGVLRNEIYRIRWDKEGHMNGVEYFSLESLDGGQPHPVILNCVARRVVRQMAGRDPEFVFPYRDISKPIDKAWVKAGLPGHKLVRKGVNNLRYTIANRLRLAGATDQEREAMFGLRNSDREHQYAVLDFQRLAELAEATITVEEPNLPVYYQAQ